jgi:hypothetical protein
MSSPSDNGRFELRVRFSVSGRHRAGGGRLMARFPGAVFEPMTGSVTDLGYYGRQFIGGSQHGSRPTAPARVRR